MPTNLTIQKLFLVAGRSPSGEPQEVQLSNLTVFVGPNSSGKSLVLSELLQSVNYQQYYPGRIVRDVEYSALTAVAAEEAITRFEAKVSYEERAAHPDSFFYLFKGGRDVQPRSHYSTLLQNPTSDILRFRQLYINNVTTFLAAEARGNLVNPEGIGNFRDPSPFSKLQALFLNRGLRQLARDVLYRAFKKFFVLDPTAGQLTIAFASRPPSSEAEEQGLHEEARNYYQSCSLIDTFSAGVKAYTGIVVELIAGSPKVVLIDEPEAFLYPPLAQQLGTEMARLAIDTGKNIFASTHSANFIMGCLHARVGVDVIRLTYRDGEATARILKNSDLTKMMRNPLLRSTGVINALFYESVIVTEADTDRAFYQEINERLLRMGRGIPNCLFLNAQNKQTVRMIAKPLRELGIPAVSIVDIDVLKEGGRVWSDYLASGFIPDLEKQSLAVMRDSLQRALVATGVDMKNGGVTLLPPEAAEAANNFFERLDEYGLFVVRHGELESWLPSLGIVGRKSEWLSSMFERLGEDPDSSGYVQPSFDDVWVFLDQIGRWFERADKKGIPP